MACFLIVILALAQLVGLGSSAPVQSLATHAAAAQQIALPSFLSQPTASGSVANLSLTATSAIAIDATNGQVLYSKAPDQARPIASVTKIFTILMILRDHSLDETVTVPQLPTYEAGAVLLNAPTGAKFKLGDLIKAALIPSDNDAADILAIHDAGSIPVFTAKMNQLMADWQITGLHFQNANGLTDTNNYATARNLSQAARLLLTNSSARTITSTQSGTITDLSGRGYALKTSNELLQTPGFYGIKTGYTPIAGQCLVALAKVNGHMVISVVLGSQDRFGETKSLINAISKGYLWQ